jgi:heat shock protein HslJ/membrane-bound inhibitor of C-type lysozyme
VTRTCSAFAAAAAGCLALLAGCAQTAKAPTLSASRPLVFASELRCGSRTLQFGVGKREGRDVPQLAVGERRIDLREVVSASGARYEAIDAAGTSVWNRGRRATDVLDGQTLAECDVVHLTPSAAATPAAGGGAPSFAPLTARGNEPAWTLTLDRRLRFIGDGLDVESPTPAGRLQDGARVHDGALTGRHVTAEVRDRVCHDSMSGMPHPYTVQVRVDDRIYRGCGGRPLDLLLGAEWVVEDIGGTGIVDRSRATLRFGADGKVGGRGSCNIYTGSYALTGENLTFGRAAATAMACAPALMQQEQRFLDLLQQVSRFDIDEAGALQLVPPDGRRITARRR